VKAFILLDIGATIANGPSRCDLNQLELHGFVWQSAANEEMGPHKRGNLARVSVSSGTGFIAGQLSERMRW